jgi:hypothetical protein
MYVIVYTISTEQEGMVSQLYCEGRDYKCLQETSCNN